MKQDPALLALCHGTSPASTPNLLLPLGAGWPQAAGKGMQTFKRGGFTLEMKQVPLPSPGCCPKIQLATTAITGGETRGKQAARLDFCTTQPPSLPGGGRCGPGDGRGDG